MAWIHTVPQRPREADKAGDRKKISIIHLNSQCHLVKKSCHVSSSDSLRL